ncbi:MAG: diaminopimelate decarboxylase [Cardiobacteriaceae bacterium]|nr:diaminopimelate decarboxylase [Cardiobacteriaceae bacterium]
MAAMDYQPWSLMDSDGSIDGVKLSDLAETYDTPLYVYSARAITKRFLAYQGKIGSHDVVVHYAVKANSNLSILKRLAKLGAGFDIVSRGELERVLLAGADPKTIVFSGVGKTDEEIVRALEVGIGCFNVESAFELERLAFLAESIGKVAPIALRINPNVDAKTHPYISTGLTENKFGIALSSAKALYHFAAKQSALQILGVGCHIGSQITELSPFLEAAQSLKKLADELVGEGINIEHIDVGGGLGIAMQEEQEVPSPEDLRLALHAVFEGSHYRIHVQPGRSLVGNSAVLLTRVVLEKEQEDYRFLVVDAAMNDYMRPALYQAKPLWRNISSSQGETKRFHIVGPVCETGDTFNKGYELSATRGDILAMAGVGAYGFSMSSSYNTRPRLAEVLIEEGKALLIRKRETLTDLWAQEWEALNHE